MSLAPGTRLGPYEIVAPMGAGGMGEVYRARDTKLNRDVAIKVLPESFALDADRVARFKREAQVLASLKHPNIAAIYGIEGSAIVMELVDGEDLSTIIARGPQGPHLRTNEAIAESLAIAKQIADALEAAHEQGIVHRDLKPQNIKVRADGTVKVLDFGLAKAMDPAGGSSDAVMNSPTMTARATQMGMIIGTAAYMAPEQAKGRAVDKRADIWAFGVVLFEMISGTRGYEAEDISDTLAAVLTREVDWTKLPPATPPPLVALLRDCLVRDPKQRLRDMGEARRVLDRLITGHSGSTIMAASSLGIAAVATQAPPWRRALPWAFAVALGTGFVVSLWQWAPWRTVPAPTPRKLAASIGVDASMPTNRGASAILSPDGTTLAFVAQAVGGAQQLFIRKLDQLTASPLAGTDDAMSPFFSPDGQWIAFFAAGNLKKVSITGGAAVTLCSAPNGRGGTWADDDTIVFTPDSTQPIKLLRVSGSGGTPTVFGTFGDGATTQRWPQALPGGKSLLYTEHNSGAGFDGANLVVAPLSGLPAEASAKAGAPKIVVRGAYYGRYLPSGHLIYMQEGTLFAVPFDLDRLEINGRAVPALEGVAANPGIGGAQLSFSADGTLAYVPGAAQASAYQIDWMTRDGKTSVLRAAKTRWANPVFSPDGRRLALEIADDKQRDIWVYEWARDTLTQLTFGASNERWPVWTPDGKRITFTSNRGNGNQQDLYWMNADGTGEPTRLTDTPNAKTPTSWHPSGKFLAFMEQSAAGWDLMLLPMEGDPARGWTPGKPTAFLATPATEVFPMFSPDGRWLAYQSNETGSGGDIYVRSFPGPGGKWRVSTGGGTWPLWSAASREILFLNTNQNKIMVAPYTVSGDSFQAGKTDLWSPTGFRSVGGTGLSPYALHPDGKRVAVNAADSTVADVQDKVVLFTHFFDYLKKIAPVKK